MLHKSLSDAILEGYLIINPVDGTRKRRYSPSEFQPLNDYQARQLVIAAKKDWRMGGGVLIQLALTTGLRQGELLGLKWSDIDWERGKLFVRRQLQRVTGKGLIFRALKTP
ncbi:MAG: tyrosine-type recombinase/integrase [Desulfobacteraceae bacterium]|nr:tyrosine-type recombinase/integrase [Desulfobacteraceae bacterium]